MMQLGVSDNHRYLVYEDGRPFFYLGDTAWELFHRLDREQADRYLSNRAAKGFTVIQAVVLAELDGLGTPNAYGDRALDDGDPSCPNEAYLRHVDAVVERAAELGLFIGMLPTWGNLWKTGGEREPLFNPQNAAAYGRLVGARYAHRPVIWILGGDQDVQNEAELAVIGAMANGLREGDGGRHLITFHPRGPGRSAEQLHDAPWLDFNMIQSSHGAQDHDNGLFTAADYMLQPPKPTLDGEPRYETLLVGFYNAGVAHHVRFDAYDVRQAAYWSLLAGACGHTYGNNNIWQMWEPGRKPLIGACVPWYEALDHPGAFQMGYVRRLFESRPYQKLAPNPDLVVDGPTSGGAHVRAARAGDGSFAFVYSPRGEPFAVRLGAIDARRVSAWWFDPRYGIAEHIHTSNNAGFQTFVPPTSGRGYDWMLVLDDEARSFPPPGAAVYGG